MSEVLITGAGGYLGLRLCKRFLKETDLVLRLCVNARDASGLEAKSNVITQELGENRNRIKFSAVDLSADAPFQSLDPSNIIHIVHSAALTRFNLESELADLVNVKGAEKVFQLAKRCPRLRNLSVLSTVYAAGLMTGIVKEDVIDGKSGFANHYERSKWQAETNLVERYGDLPWNILRIATVIADDRSGKVTQQNAVHNTLKLFYYGLLSLFPGDPETPLYLVTGDFVEDACFAISQSTHQKQIFHVCHQLSESIKLADFIDIVFKKFENFADFKNRRVLRPLWSDAESFDLLVEGVNSLNDVGIVNQAVSSVAPFARQLFAAKDFHNDNLRSVYGSYAAPDPVKLVENTADYLASSRWGRQPQHVN